MLDSIALIALLACFDCSPNSACTWVSYLHLESCLGVALPPPVVDGSVTNLQEVDPSKTDHPKWMRDMWSEKVQAVDKNVIDKELEARLESKPPELSHVGPGEELFVTFGTASVTDFVQNWVKSANELGLSPLFVGALDEDMYEWCKKCNSP